MSDFQTCFQWAMQNEDSTMACACVPDMPGQWQIANGQKTWNGAQAISGINSAAYPTQFATIAALPQDQRSPAVANFYQTAFWNNSYAQLNSDNLAQRVFDEAVNAGPQTAVRILQQAINAVAAAINAPATPDGNAYPIATDGLWGAVTIGCANSFTDDQLVPAFQQARLAHYEAIVAAKPADAVYLGTPANPGPWMIRALQ